MNDLLENIDKLHTTEMGVERIKKNLQIEVDDVVQWCKTQILNKAAGSPDVHSWFPHSPRKSRRTPDKAP